MINRNALQEKPEITQGPESGRIDWLLDQVSGDIFTSNQAGIFYAHRSNPNVTNFGDFVRMDDAFLTFDSGFISTGNSPFTVMVRIRMPQGFGGLGYGVAFGFGNDATNQGYIMSLNTGATGFRQNFGNGAGNVQGGTVSAGVWYTVCGRYDGVTSQIWANGVLISSAAYSAANTNAQNWLGGFSGGIGAFYSSGGGVHGAYEGDTRDIAWARYYKRAIDPAEIRQAVDSPFMDFVQRPLQVSSSLSTVVNRRSLGSRVGSRTIQFT